MIRKLIQSEVLKQGLSIYRLSQMSGVQETSIKRFLDEKKTLTVESIEKILDALGVREILLIFQRDISG